MENTNSIKLHIRFLSCFLMALAVIVPKEGSAQLNGGLLMLPDNFQAQMLNPSYFRNDNALIIAVPGLSGFSFRSSANFKITDLIYTQSTGEMVYDLNHFMRNGNTVNSISQWISVPLVYVGIPIENGMISMFYREQIQHSVYFPGKALAWFENGNVPELYRNYESGNINGRILGYHELAVGITRKLKNNLQAGIRAKLIFGAAYVQGENWNFGINTSETGDEILLTSSGTGAIASGFPVEFNDYGQIQRVNLDHFAGNYLTSFYNPGLAFDFGFTTNLDKRNKVAVSLTDFGFIWFRKNGWEMNQDGSFLFKGMDISDVLEIRNDGEYVSPLKVMLDTKDNLRNVFRPFGTESNFLTGISPKLMLHYQHEYTDFISFGISNQSVFQKEYFLNIFSLNTRYDIANFSVTGNISAYNIESVMIGGGVQWTNRYSQLFFFADNLLAAYHPASQKSFSFTVGMNLLLNQDISMYKNKSFDRRGKTSIFRPYYKKYK